MFLTEPFYNTLRMVFDDSEREGRIKEMNGGMKDTDVVFLVHHVHVIMIPQMKSGARRSHLVIIKNAILWAIVCFLFNS